MMKKLLVIVLFISIISGLHACALTEKDTIREEDIRAVCELATLKCYYNNVAKLEKKADNIFQKDRQMWIEYEGEAVIGIDMAKVEIKINGGEVSISIPDAEIQSIKPITDTLTEESYIVSSDGWLFTNKIEVKDQQDAIIRGQQEMEQAVRSNQGLFRQAEENAKELIENYINKIGEATNVEYTIVWKS